jgi:hypothetical protein
MASSLNGQSQWWTLTVYVITEDAARNARAPMAQFVRPLFVGYGVIEKTDFPT